MARLYKRLRTAQSLPGLDHETLYCLAHGNTLIAGVPSGLVQRYGCETLPGPAAGLVKLHGIAEIRRLCELEKITKPGEKLWCETLKRKNHDQEIR